MGQKFIARVKRVCDNGAIAWAPGGPFDCVGYWAKIQNCPVMIGEKEVARLTCYATGSHCTFFSIPACTKHKGKHIGGFFTLKDDQPVFIVYDRFINRFNVEKV